MPAATQNTVRVADQDTGTLAVQTDHGDGLDLKNVARDDEEKSFIEGYAATTHQDDANDIFTVEALEDMAETIRNDADATVDVVTPHLDGMEESQIGNLNHNNNPIAQELIGAGDTRTIPVFKTVHAETHKLTDGETGLYIRGEMLPLPDDLEDAVKGQIREGALHSFSIEFAPTDVSFKFKDGETIRQINASTPQGTALTGRPMNQDANMTNAELKTVLAKNNIKTEDTPMGEEQEQESPESQVEEQETPDEEVQDEETVEEQEEVVDEQDESEPEEDSAPEEEDSEEVEDESEDAEDSEGEDQAGELKNDVKELKSMFKDIKEENEELRNENQELKSKLDDLKTMDGLKSEINDIKSLIEDSGEDLEGDRPIADPDEEREVKNQTQKPRWQRVIDQLGYTEDDLKSVIGNKGMTEAETIAETHGVETEEVLDYAN